MIFDRKLPLTKVSVIDDDVGCELAKAMIMLLSGLVQKNDALI